MRFRALYCAGEHAAEQFAGALDADIGIHGVALTDIGEQLHDLRQCLRVAFRFSSHAALRDSCRQF
jgi:hypothetical protein